MNILHIEVAEQIDTKDIFYSAKKFVHFLHNLFIDKYLLVNIERSITISWKPILARCPEGGRVNLLTTYKAAALN